MDQEKKPLTIREIVQEDSQKKTPYRPFSRAVPVAVGEGIGGQIKHMFRHRRPQAEKEIDD